MKEGDQQVCLDAVRIGNYQEKEVPKTAQELANRILHTVYMGTENRSVGLTVYTQPETVHLIALGTLIALFYKYLKNTRRV